MYHLQNHFFLHSFSLYLCQLVLFIETVYFKRGKQISESCEEYSPNEKSIHMSPYNSEMSHANCTQYYFVVLATLLPPTSNSRLTSSNHGNSLANERTRRRAYSSKPYNSAPGQEISYRHSHSGSLWPNP